MKIIIEKKEKLEQIVADKIIDLVNKNPKANLGLATGETFLNVYDLLASDHKENKTDYSEVVTFNLDEYLDIKEDNPQSYHYYMNKNLFSHININNINSHLPCLTIPYQEAIDKYNELLENHPIDIQLLGIGGNGHIGFNEPFTSFESTTHRAVLSEKSRKDNSRFFDSIDEVPTHTITMGIKNIMEAKKIVVLATGKKKAEIVKRIIHGTVDVSVPATVLQKHPDVTFYLDHECAQYLSINREV